MSLSAKALKDPNRLIQRMENNMREKLAYIASRHPLMATINIDDILVVNANMPSDTFNTVYGGNINNDNAKAVYDYYAKRGFPCAWWVGPSSEGKKTHDALESAGFYVDEYDVGMVCDLSLLKEDYQLPQPIKIKRCKSKQDFCDFGLVLGSIFEPSAEAKNVEKYYQQINLVDEQKRQALELFVGYVEGKPVATSSVFYSDVAGIFDISTKPIERKKGYGTALFYHALLSAKERGFDISVLQASPDGLNIYKRFGFTELADFNVWTNVNG